MRDKKIAIMGMGYVGLTLSVVLARRGFKVYGIEINRSVAQDLKNGRPHFHENRLEVLLKEQQRLGGLEILESLPDCGIDVYIVSVGTPLKKGTKEPNMEHIKNVTSSVAVHMKKGSMVALRSTVPVGTSRNVVIPLLEEKSGLKAGRDFSFVFSPERTMEGKAILELEENPQIIGGLDEESLSRASELFRKLTNTVVNVSSLEAAEMIKIIDNTSRDVRFAYANEIALMCEKLGLDAVELIKSANIHYPRNNIPVPSPGVGGACLSKDPHILIDFSRKAGYEPRLIAESRNINEYVPVHIVERVRDTFSSMGKDLSDAKIFLVGFAFKGEPETSDLRDSTSLWLLEALKKYSNNIYGYDPLVEGKDLTPLGVKACATLEEGFSGADAVLFLNNHRSYLQLNPAEICSKMNKPGIFYDSWRMFERDSFKEIEGVTYMSVGL
jgi:UDP-N-acetyl-D-mannosaminuronic acid dehydrogenase